MKVSKTGSTTQAGSTRKTKKTDDAGGSFADALKDTAAGGEVDSASGLVGVGSVDGVLALQEASDATDHRSRGLLMERGSDLLDRLEQIRLGLLNGSISKNRLHDLAKRLRERASESDDPRLNDLISDIELRVEVELAKLAR
jgi:hypothetical protein